MYSGLLVKYVDRDHCFLEKRLDSFERRHGSLFFGEGHGWNALFFGARHGRASCFFAERHRMGIIVLFWRKAWMELMAFCTKAWMEFLFFWRKAWIEFIFLGEKKNYSGKAAKPNENNRLNARTSGKVRKTIWRVVLGRAGSP